MPELPEVETVRRGMLAHLPGRRLRRVELRRHDLRWPLPVASIEALAGRRCTRIDRRSKYIQMLFSGAGAPVALIHLGMSGRIAVQAVTRRGRRPEWELHEHWRMDFGERLVRFTDPRRFGMLDVAATDRLAQHRLLASLGPEPLGSEFDAEYVYRATRRRKVALKTFLMDARRVVGVGNIYASEACFRAGLRPLRGVARLRRSDCGRIVSAVRDVLADAIRAGGTTLRDHADVDGDTGYFQRELSVYGRAGEPCRRCRTPIKRVVRSGRATYYCPECQR